VRQGKFVVVLDDEDRENEGDLICAADRVTTERMAFMVEHTSGVICVGMRGEDCDRLDLPLMVASRENNECMYTAFTVTADLAEGTTTGISASDRAATLRALASPATPSAAFKRPGHIFPLRARPGGVVVRPGHTEAAVDLARLAGCFPAGALCEVVDRRDGSMARTQGLVAFSREHGLKCITIADLIRYRLRTEPERLVVPVDHAAAGVGGGVGGNIDGARRGEQERRRKEAAEAAQVAAAAAAGGGGVPIDTRHGRFYAHAFRSAVDPSVEHVALVAPAATTTSSSGGPQQQQPPSPPPLACLQLQSGVVDALGSQHCGAEAGLDAALRAVASAGPAGGVVLYVRSAADGAPRGLAAELAAHARREARGCGVGGGAAGAAAGEGEEEGGGEDGRPRDLRDFAAASGMLRHLGMRSVRVLADEDGLEDAAARWRAAGAEVVGAEPLPRRRGDGGGGGGGEAAATAGDRANGHQLNGSAHAAGVLTAV
jgi:3,4-dihydroxy 2-butanone 4-phosphate synthase / GTP cyclohydrolase II